MSKQTGQVAEVPAPSSHSGQPRRALWAFLCPEQCAYPALRGKVGDPGPVAGVGMSTELVSVSHLLSCSCERQHPLLMAAHHAMGAVPHHSSWGRCCEQLPVRGMETGTQGGGPALVSQLCPSPGNSQAQGASIQLGWQVRMNP